MIEIALRRSLSKVVAGPRVATGEQGKTDRGWQGKSAGRPSGYVVGGVGGFRSSAAMTAAGAFSEILKRNQGSERHRPVAQGGFAP